MPAAELLEERRLRLHRGDQRGDDVDNAAAEGFVAAALASGPLPVINPGGRLSDSWIEADQHRVAFLRTAAARRSAKWLAGSTGVVMSVRPSTKYSVQMY